MFSLLPNIMANLTPMLHRFCRQCAYVETVCSSTYLLLLLLLLPETEFRFCIAFPFPSFCRVSPSPSPHSFVARSLFFPFRSKEWKAELTQHRCSKIAIRIRIRRLSLDLNVTWYISWLIRRKCTPLQMNPSIECDYPLRIRFLYILCKSFPFRRCPLSDFLLVVSRMLKK